MDQELKEYLDGKFSAIDDKFAAIDGKFAGIDDKFAGIDGKFAGIDGKFAGIDGKFAGIDGKFAGIDGKFGDLEERLAGRIDAAEERTRTYVREQCHTVETNLLHAFHGWARSMEIRVRGVGAVTMGFEERLGLVEERMGELERKKAS
jgi:hypothetical protein